MGSSVEQTERPALSVIVPVFNGEAFIADTVRALLDYLRTLGRLAELIVVDDGSTDLTAALLERITAGAATPVQVIRSERNQGKGAAIVRGMQAARGDVRVFLDADLAYPPSEIERVCRSLSAGADVAIANRVAPSSRYVVSPSFFRYLYTRHVAGRLFNWIVRLLLLPRIRDSQAGLKGFTAAAAERLFAAPLPSGFSFDLGLLHRARRLGLKIDQIGVLYRYDSEPTTFRFLLDTVIVLRDLLLIRLGFVDKLPPALVRPNRGRVARALQTDVARAVLIAVTGLSMIALVVTRVPFPRPTVALLAWIAALAGIALLAWRADAGGADLRPHLFHRRGEALLFALVFAACAVLRFARLGELPPMVHLDTAECGLMGLNLLHGQVKDVFDFSPWYNTPYLSFLPYAASFALVGPNIIGLRLPSAILGTLTIVPLYLLVRTWFGSRAALLCTALYAVSHAAIHFSRIGLWNIQVLFYEITAFAALAVALRRGSALWAVGAGVVSGLALYSYTAGRLIPIVAVLFLALQILRGAWRHTLRTAFCYAIGLAVAATPLVLDYVKDPSVLEIDRTGSVSVLAEINRHHVEATLGTVSTPGVLWEQTKRTLLGFATLGDTSTQYGTGQPLLSPWMALLAAVGFALALWRIRDRRHLFLVLWTVLGLVLGSILILDPPSYTRLIILFPVPFIFVAVCLEALLRRSGRWIRLRRADVAAIYLLLVAVATSFNLIGYYRFVRFMNDMPREWDVLRVLDRMGTTYDYYLFTGPFLLADSPIFQFFSHGTRAVTGFSEQDLPEHLSRDAAFVLIPEFRRIGETISELYPGAEREVIQQDGRRQMFIYRCTADDGCRRDLHE